MKVINYSLVRILFALIVGLILIIWPDVAVNYLVITVGILFLIPGIISIIGYIASRPRETAGVRLPIEGLGSILSGLWLIILPAIFSNILIFCFGFFVTFCLEVHMFELNSYSLLSYFVFFFSSFTSYSPSCYLLFSFA